MRKALLATVMMAGLVCWASVAHAAPALTYEGSFNLPRSNTANLGFNDYYASRMVFVPNGNTRPGNGTTPTGPTLLVTYNHAHHVVEFSLDGVTPKTSGLDTAAWLNNASGGTLYVTNDVGYASPVSVDSAGNLWDSQLGSSSVPSGLWSRPNTATYQPNISVLGQGAPSTPAPTAQESGWYAGYPNGGVMRLGDGSGGNLPTDGTDIGATFLTASHLNSGPGYYVTIANNVRTGVTTMSSSSLFQLSQASFVAGIGVQVSYVRVPGDQEYYIVWKSGAHSSDSFTLSFYDPTASGVDPTPAFTYDIGADIAGGAGFLVSTSVIQFVTVDWATNTLYVMDAGTSSGGGQDVRVHVFSITAVPEPATMTLLAIGGFGLIGAGIRRRRSA